MASAARTLAAAKKDSAPTSEAPASEEKATRRPPVRKPGQVVNRRSNAQLVEFYQKKIADLNAEYLERSSKLEKKLANAMKGQIELPGEEIAKVAAKSESEIRREIALMKAALRAKGCVRPRTTAPAAT